MDDFDTNLYILLDRIKDAALINGLASFMPEKEARIIKRFFGAFMKRGVPPHTVLNVLSELCEEGLFNDE